MPTIAKFTARGVRFLTNGHNVGPVISYARLKQSYICARCGGRMEEHFNGAWHYACCGRCGNDKEVVSYAQQRRELVEATEVLAGLPVELRRAFRPQSSLSEDEVQEIACALYGGDHAA